MEKTLRLSAEQREDLVAYLDGELPDVQAQQIDMVLARSEVARHEVEALARTWEMLDVLPKPKAAPEFTERTMTTLRVAEAPFDITQHAWFGYLKKALVAAVWIAALGCSGWLGFQITNVWIENPAKQLLVNLPVVEKLDLYQEVESIDFLDKLRSSRLFDDSGAVTETRSTGGKTLEQRHTLIVKMSQVERDRLQRNLQSFEVLTPDQKEHYRQLNIQLEEKRKSGDGLIGLMSTYSAWLETLTPGQREELRKEPDSARKLSLVQKIKEEQYRQVETFSNDPPPVERGPRPLLPSELNAVMKMLLADLPEDEQKKLGKGHKPEQFVEILRRSVHHYPDGPREWPSSAVQDEILKSVPSQIRTYIKRNPAIQRERAVAILFNSVRQVAEGPRPRYPNSDDLQQIVQGMSDEQKKKLDDLPGDERHDKLVQQYFESHGKHRQDLMKGLIGLVREVGLIMPPRTNGEPPLRPGDRPGDRRGPGGPNDRGPNDRGPGEKGFEGGPADRPSRQEPPTPRPDPPPPRDRERERNQKQ